MWHHRAVVVFHAGIQENPSGARGSWRGRDQHLEGVFSHLGRKRSCQWERRGSRRASSPAWVPPPPQLPTCCLPRNLEGQTLLAPKVPVPKCWPSAEVPLAAPILLSVCLSQHLWGPSVQSGLDTTQRWWVIRKGKRKKGKWEKQMGWHELGGRGSSPTSCTQMV